ncbi:MAG: DUF2306 domain-containing protein [Vicinamibacterales bacterium]
MDFTLDGLRSAVLVTHIIAGAFGLILAWPALIAPKRRGAHTRVGRVYAIAIVVLCLTTFVLFAFDPVELIGLGVLGVLTFGWVTAGVWLARNKPRPRRGDWLTWHLNLMSSSVIAVVTAFAVQMLDGHLIAWLGPTIVGSPLISYRTAVQRGAPLPWPGRSQRRRHSAA